MSESEQHADQPPTAAPSAAQSRGLWIILCSLGVLGLVAVVLILMTLSPTSQSESHPAVGNRLAALDLKPLTGDATPVILDDLKGKVVLVNFWGTWCPPCRVELPHLVEVADKFAGQPSFRFLPISCGPDGAEDTEELRSRTEEMLQQLGLHVATYCDPTLTTRRAFDKVGRFMGFPTTFLMDRQGVIRHVWIGYYPQVSQQVENGIRELLAQESSLRGENRP
jgi:thiol-disulfide isomerase/thioredoxin